MSSLEALAQCLDALLPAARRTGDDRISVSLDRGRKVELVLTDEDVDMLHVAFGRTSDIADYLLGELASLPEDHGFLVYGQYDVEPSHTPERVEPPEEEHPGPGEWFAFDSDGRTGSHFSEWTEPGD